MNLPDLTVRDARPGDASALLSLWVEASERAGQPEAFVGDAEDALTRLADNPDERLLVAVCGDVVVGSVHLRRATLTPLHTRQAVHTSFLCVRAQDRRQGVAHVLLEHAVTWAEELEVDTVSAISVSTSRETSRWLARLGLTPAATVRLSTTSALRRRLRADRSGRVGAVIAQRRTLRRRSQGVPVS